MEKRPKLSTIIFDMGGVLSHYDEDIPIKEFTRLSGKPEQEIVRSLYTPERKRPLETGIVSWQEFTAQIKSELELNITDDEFKRIYNSPLYAPIDSLFPIIERLSNQYRIGICSNTGPTHWELQRERLPFFDRFDPIILSCEVGIMKPDRGIFDEISRQAEVPLHEILFIDDHIENVRSAQSIGMKSIHFTDHIAFSDSLANHGIST